MFGMKKAKPFDPTTLTYSELRQLRGTIDELMQAQFSQAQESFRRDFLEKMSEFGLSIEDLVAAGRKSPKAKEGAPEKKRREARIKYRNPENHDEVWTGLGKPKKWLAAKLAAGHALEEFAIEPNGSAA
jgi:DNA-binding protein H-NS